MTSLEKSGDLTANTSSVIDYSNGLLSINGKLTGNQITGLLHLPVGAKFTIETTCR
jgi:hypothetical protein